MQDMIGLVFSGVSLCQTHFNGDFPIAPSELMGGPHCNLMINSTCPSNNIEELQQLSA